MRTVLYQKYRPVNFGQTVGQTGIKQTIINAINQKQLPNGYIFAGERGTGKTTFAKLTAKAINCFNWNGSDVCDRCESCLSITDNSAMDVLEIDAASKNGINDIRELAENVFNHPFKFKKKVYILDEAHMLTLQSWSGLLKTLEETPPYVLFIFATTEFNKIPLTILSRCQSFFFKPITNNLIVERLNLVVENEKIKIEPLALKKLADLSQGSLRDGLSLLDQISNFHDKKTITLSDVEKVFNLIDQTKKYEFIETVLGGDIKGSFNLIDSFESQGINFIYFVREIFTLLVDLYGYVKTKNITILKEADRNLAVKLNFTAWHYSALIKAIEASVGYGRTQLTLSDQLKAIVIHFNNAITALQKQNVVQTTPAQIPSTKQPILDQPKKVLESKQQLFENDKKLQTAVSMQPQADILVNSTKNENQTNTPMDMDLNNQSIALIVQAYNDPELLEKFKQILVDFKAKFPDPTLNNFKGFADKYSARDLSQTISIEAASPFGLVLLFEKKTTAQNLTSESFEDSATQATVFEIFNQNLYLACFSEEEYKNSSAFLKGTKLPEKPKPLDVEFLKGLSQTALKNKKKSSSRKIANDYFKGLFVEK